jgi:hypothetical protein
MRSRGGRVTAVHASGAGVGDGAGSEVASCVDPGRVGRWDAVGDVAAGLDAAVAAGPAAVGAVGPGPLGPPVGLPIRSSPAMSPAATTATAAAGRNLG